ncbi:iron transporter [Halomicroarcula sp. F13]|uniref:Iron transporter n=1 Tax=Haloarcula rubra TaxID=2487747 RepID=A0AAW4PN00_9EURY|nr:iron transporter [Halomicroarcula rubra]MBX0321808.1 iron transporter [Halomicroarcula rubra]
MDRRRFLASAGLAGASLVAGCGSFQSQSTRAPPLVENRPDGTYRPTHVEGMGMAGMAEAGDYMVGFGYSFPHRFWTVTGTDAERVDIRDADSVHLMATVWDPETEMVLPISAGVSIAIERDGETVDEKSPWPMISQNMGFHYGDNYELDGDGLYTLKARVNAMDERRLGPFAEKFSEAAEASVEFDFAQSALDQLSYEEFPETQGERGAVDLMSMEMMPTSQTPVAGELPGTLLGTKKGSDGVYAATWLSEADFLADGESYLAVSARTPYNRVPLPMMSLDGSVEAGGETVFDDALTAALHPDLGYHYGAVVETTGTDPSVGVDVVAPPQVSRHEGYETAFVGTPSFSF